MSESKRFKPSEIYSNTIMDTENCINNGSHCRIYDIEEVVDLLNKLVKDNEELGISIKLFEDDVATKDKKIGEQQATISALKEENEQLRGINKEIGDDLHNCRLNKDIVSEKLKLWQDTLAEYDIYTIKDFKELMKNDN